MDKQADKSGLNKCHNEIKTLAWSYPFWGASTAWALGHRRLYLSWGRWVDGWHQSGNYWLLQGCTQVRYSQITSGMGSYPGWLFPGTPSLCVSFLAKQRGLLSSRLSWVGPLPPWISEVGWVVFCVFVSATGAPSHWYSFCGFHFNSRWLRGSPEKQMMHKFWEEERIALPSAAISD